MSGQGEKLLVCKNCWKNVVVYQDDYYFYYSGLKDNAWTIERYLKEDLSNDGFASASNNKTVTNISDAQTNRDQLIYTNYAQTRAAQFDGVVDTMTSAVLNANTRLSMNDEFSVSLWINPEWTIAGGFKLNTLFSLNGGSFYSNGLNFMFEQSLNRLWLYKTKVVSGVDSYQAEAYSLHNNNAITGTGSSASSKWSGSNKGNVNSNNYVHLVVVNDPDANRVYIYWNSQALDNASDSLRNLTFGSAFTTQDISSQKIQIGAIGSGNYSQKSIDEIYLFDKKLGQSEITALYNSGSPKDERSHSNLIEAYLMEGNAISELGKNNLVNNGATFINSHA